MSKRKKSNDEDSSGRPTKKQSTTGQMQCSYLSFASTVALRLPDPVAWRITEFLMPKSLDTAAANGQLAIVKLYSPLCNVTQDGMNFAAREGHLDVMKWLHENRTEGCSRKAMKLAVSNGHLDIVKWLHQHYEEKCGPLILHIAVQAGHTDIVQWLWTSCDHDVRHAKSSVFYLAVEAGHIELAKWMHFNDDCGVGCHVDSLGADGEREMVKWLIANCSKATIEGAMDGAILEGNLDMVQWLHHTYSEHVPTDSPMVAAAVGNQIPILKWLHEHNYPCSTTAMDVAAEVDSLEAIIWLHENRTEGCTTDALDNAVHIFNFRTAEWLAKIEGKDVAWNVWHLQCATKG